MFLVLINCFKFHNPHDVYYEKKQNGKLFKYLQAEIAAGGSMWLELEF